MKNLSSLNKYFWKYKKLFGLGILFIILTNIFQVYTPKIIKLAMDLIVSMTNSAGNAEGPRKVTAELHSDFGIDISSLFDFSTPEAVTASIIKMSLYLGALYLFIYIIKGVFLFYTRQTLIVMSRYIEYDLKNEIFDQYQKLDTAFYKRNNTGDLMNRISEDVSKVRMYLGPGIMYTINLGFLFVMTIWFMLIEDAELTLWVLAPMPVMSIVIYYVSDLINKKSNLVQEQQSQLSTLAQEAFSGIRVLKAYSREQAFRENFIAQSELYKTRQMDRVKVDALFMPVMTMLIGLSTLIAIYVGGLKTIDHEISVGTIAEFIMYVNMLTWPFAAVGWVTSINQQAAASMQRINEFLHIQPEIQSPTDNLKHEFKGEINFDKVTFVYPDSGTVALKNVSFTIKPGETLAIVGHTGSGKSSIASLICRQYDPTSGQVNLDGIELKQHNLNELRTNIGYVPQEVFLFSDSIANNISFGIKGMAERPMVEQAAKDACIHDNITDFKDGYETLLGERGITLSGGQKQRVSIARAIIKQPQILVFDDCLSAVDTETEDRILQNLNRVMKDKTTVLISHRISTVKNADKIIVLQDGAIIEEGNHRQLLSLQGHYFDLYQKQLLEEANLTSPKNP